MKRLRERIATTFICCAIIVAPVITVLANSKTRTAEYGGFSITYSIEVTSNKAKGTTGGSANPYYNEVIVTAYKSTGTSIGTNSARNRDALASATVSKMGQVNKGHTVHYVTDVNHAHLEAFNNSLKLTILK